MNRQTEMSDQYIQPNELPYLTAVPHDGRATVVATYYDEIEKRFKSYSPQPDGRMFVLHPVSLIEGSYLATNPENPKTDFRLILTEAIIQHFSFPGLLRQVEFIERDLLNALASIHKYFILLAHFSTDDALVYRLLVSTEIEYLIANHRAFYDRLQEVIRGLRAQLHANPQPMPVSFARVVGKSDDELLHRYGLPEQLVQFYRSQENSFLAIREVRNNVFHHGHSPELIYLFPDGFAIGFGDRVTDRLRSLDLWPDDLLRPNGLGSLLPLFAFIVNDMLEAMRVLARVFADVFSTAPALAEGYRNFLRTELRMHLSSLERYLQTQWIHPDEVLQAR